ncbi:MAG: 3-isopropylmalate dehydrogenase [Anaerolineae bacterium]|nr:3-isopropylmalate dehydrogenase [Phycisphaerae bacterium]
MNARIAVLPGDGIGPEVTREAVRVLCAIGERFGHRFEFAECPFGGAAIDATGEPLPATTLARCRDSHAVLLGAVGGPKWNDVSRERRPEAGLLALRQQLALFANIRPIKPTSIGARSSPLKAEILRDVDLIVVRELTGGIYYGAKTRSDDEASDLCIYRRAEVERIIRLAASLAQSRRGKLTSVDKSNVLETSRLWREVTDEIVTREFPQLQLEHLLVDAAAMHLLTRPRSFDVIVTENMFGDILTDEASVLAGSIGMVPSGSLGDAITDAGRFGVYEPIHGSAPDLAGSNIANPYGSILSAAMLLRFSLKLPDAASAIEQAVETAMTSQALPRDLAGTASSPELGDAVIACMHTPAKSC